MSYAVISDVHSNLDALEAVFLEIDRRGVKEIFFIGDAVGYGPDPNECIEMLLKRCSVLLAGNHDWAATGLADISYFNEYARFAIEWTSDVLTEQNKKILGEFQLVKEDKKKDAFFVHSTPKRPEEWNYLMTLWDAEMAFHSFDAGFCFLGHTHQPFIIERVPSGELITFKNNVSIKKGSRYIINAGSVGQPRDGNPHACCVFANEEKIDIVRIPYAVERVQDKMREKNLSYHLIERLAVGR